jgi:hypothetical protein
MYVLCQLLAANTPWLKKMCAPQPCRRVMSAAGAVGRVDRWLCAVGCGTACSVLLMALWQWQEGGCLTGASPSTITKDRLQGVVLYMHTSLARSG